MDNGLVHFKASAADLKKQVLILIVVDNGLVQLQLQLYRCLKTVLILIVVDNGLVREIRGMVAEKLSKS